MENEEMSKADLIAMLVSIRIISGNPRQFNYRDESAGLCVSAQKI